MPDPLVSVVIPLYNAEEWIEATVRSVQQQTVERELLELIVVDNGSTDRGVELVRDLLSGSAPQYEVICLDSNCGPSFARNVGWRRSRAPWIQFLDSDDLLVADKIHQQLRVARTAPPEVAVVYSEWQFYSLDGEWAPQPPLIAPRILTDVVRELLTTGNFVATGSGLFRKTWLAKVGGYDQKCWLIEDVHLNLRLAMAGGSFLCAPVGRALFYYRRRGSSLSTRRVEFLKGCVRNLRLAQAYWFEKSWMTEDRRRFLLNSYEHLLHNLAELDTPDFGELLANVRSLSPGWVPRNRKMRFLTRLFGYRAAEHVAIWYRKVKARLGGIWRVPRSAL